MLTLCPCGSGETIAACCGPIVDGVTRAPTAEALMRSRFTAFALGRYEYIRQTHASEMRTDTDVSGDDGIEWTHLDVLERAAGGVEDEMGTVTFAAHYRHRGVPGIHRERSRFRRDNGDWVYVDGDVEIAAHAKVGRNDRCPCGSGKKFKKCCGVR